MSDYYEPGIAAYRLQNMSDSVGRLVLSGDFPKVRLYFSDRFQELIERAPHPHYELDEHFPGKEAVIPDHATPDDLAILRMWHSWLPLKETFALTDDKGNTPSILPPERVDFYLKLVQQKISSASHPYDKAGAILEVFKAYRTEVQSHIARPLRTMHVTLRGSMTRSMFKFAKAAMAKDEALGAPDGFSTTLSEIYASPQMRAHLTDEPPPFLPQPSNATFLSFSSNDTIWTESWLGNQDEIINSRKCLGKVIQSIPGSALSLLDPYGDARFLRSPLKQRKPPIWFVLRHYMMTHCAKTWDREFVFDAVLRKGTTLDSLSPEIAADVAHAKEVMQDTEKSSPRLCSLMSDTAFTEKWDLAYSSAWRDYRRLRQLSMQEDYDVAISQSCDPSSGEMMPALRKDVNKVFIPPFNQQPIDVRSKLLNRVVPGLGESYKTVLAVHEYLGASDEAIKEAFSAALEELQSPSNEGLTAPLPDLMYS